MGTRNGLRGKGRCSHSTAHRSDPQLLHAPFAAWVWQDFRDTRGGGAGRPGGERAAPPRAAPPPPPRRPSPAARLPGSLATPFAARRLAFCLLIVAPGAYTRSFSPGCDPGIESNGGNVMAFASFFFHTTARRSALVILTLFAVALGLN